MAQDFTGPQRITRGKAVSEGPGHTGCLVQGRMAPGRQLPDCLSANTDGPRQSRMDSYLVLFHAPHQLFCLNPQVSAQREGSREKNQLNTTLLRAGSLPLASAHMPVSELEATLHHSWALEGRH